jgi:hypothetical protein
MTGGSRNGFQDYRGGEFQTVKSVSWRVNILKVYTSGRTTTGQATGSRLSSSDTTKASWSRGHLGQYIKAIINRGVKAVCCPCV